MLAAALTPIVYTVGMNLGAKAEAEDLPALLEFVGKKAVKSQHKYGKFFARSLMFSALVLLIPLIRSLKNKAQSKPTKSSFFKRIKPTGIDMMDLCIGFITASLGLLILGSILIQLDWRMWRESIDIGKAFNKAIPPAIIVAIIEEWLFRGVLFAVLLRTMKPMKAMLFLSIFFAAVHFLQPPKGVVIAQPEAWYSGFILLRHIGELFLQPESIIGVFITLFIVGYILAYSAYRTGKLWLPIGLHMGWVFALKFNSKLTQSNKHLDYDVSMWIGKSIKDGVFPLITLAITGGIILWYLGGKKTQKLSYPHTPHSEQTENGEDTEDTVAS